MAAPRKGFRIREIVFAVGMGALAAGGAAITLSAMHDDEQPATITAEGSGARSYKVAPFDRISSAGPQDVQVIYGDALAVRAEGPARALRQLEVTVEDGQLAIRPKGGSFWGDWDGDEDVTFYVTLPRLNEVTMAGSGEIRIDRIEGDSFKGTVAASGAITIDQLKVKDAEFTIAAAGNVRVDGTVDNTKATIAGSGQIEGDGLRSRTASISIGGSGDVALTVDQDAQVSIAGSGNVDISGPGRCSVTRMGSGNVSCEGGGGDDN